MDHYFIYVFIYRHMACDSRAAARHISTIQITPNTCGKAVNRNHTINNSCFAQSPVILPVAQINNTRKKKEVLAYQKGRAAILWACERRSCASRLPKDKIECYSIARNVQGKKKKTFS